MIKLTEKELKRAQRIDRFLLGYANTWGGNRYTRKSPLYGCGKHFVYWGRVYIVDELLVLAIAGQETAYGTYKPCQPIFNAWGLGPHHDLVSWPKGIRKATFTLRRYYLDEGRTTIPTIGAKWAPVGAANDPRNLNSEWVKAVTQIYKRFGGKRYGV